MTDVAMETMTDLTMVLSRADLASLWKQMITLAAGRSLWYMSGDF